MRIRSTSLKEPEGWEYDERNWLQPPEGGFSRLNAAL